MIKQRFKWHPFRRRNSLREWKEPCFRNNGNIIGNKSLVQCVGKKDIKKAGMFHKVRLNCSIHLFFDLSVSEKLQRNIFSDFSSSFDPDRWLLAFLCTCGGGLLLSYHGTMAVHVPFVCVPKCSQCVWISLCHQLLTGIAQTESGAWHVFYASRQTCVVCCKVETRLMPPFLDLLSWRTTLTN